jgi:hypothetical protein
VPPRVQAFFTGAFAPSRRPGRASAFVAELEQAFR